jgi:hypothetical protein
MCTYYTLCIPLLFSSAMTSWVLILFHNIPDKVQHLPSVCRMVHGGPPPLCPQTVRREYQRSGWRRPCEQHLTEHHAQEVGQVCSNEGDIIIDLTASSGKGHFIISIAQSEFHYFCIITFYYTLLSVGSSLEAARAVGCHILGVEGNEDLVWMYLRASYPSMIAKFNDNGSFNSFKENRDDSPQW